MKPIRVLVVDDSATMRMLISSLLEDAGGIEVVGAAPNPDAAREMIKTLNPDVLTLDIEMPGMSGIEFLEKIMRLRPMPVVMVSTLTQQGAEHSIEAMRLGAIGCFGKPVAGRADAFTTEGHKLVAMVREAATANVTQIARVTNDLQRAAYHWNGNLVAIGASTGGVEALFRVISQLPADCPPTLIVQHMPPHFTTSFAKRLNDTCAPRVVEAQNGMSVDMGTVYIAPGGEKHLELDGFPTSKLKLVPGQLVSGHQPSVDRLFHTVARAAGSSAVGVLMTGMGSDGAKGLAAMRAAGAYTIAQDEATSVVYGMPRAAVQAGAAMAELPLGAIAGEVLSRTRAQLAA